MNGLSNLIQLSQIISLSLPSPSLSLVDENDYTSLDEFLTFEPSEATEQSVCHPVVVHDDREVEGAEFFQLRLTSSDPVVILDPATATVTITEGDGKHNMLHVVPCILYMLNFWLPISVTCMYYSMLPHPHGLPSFSIIETLKTWEEPSLG